jgi:transposase InsO family protein
MSRIGCPYDNAKAESFMKTLKQEEVDGKGVPHRPCAVHVRWHQIPLGLAGPRLHSGIVLG